MVKLKLVLKPFIPSLVIGLAGFILVINAQKPITIHGNWSPWSEISTPCLRPNSLGIKVPVTCGGGTQTRVRSCTNPKPQGLRPDYCQGEEQQSIKCAENPCDMQWSEWTDCSAACGRGNRQRKTLCAESSGGNLTDCKLLGLKNQSFEHVEACNTWNKDTCKSPCEGYNCMEYAICVDTSDDLDPKTECVCQLGRIMNEAGDSCIVPPTTLSTERTIPTLPPELKSASTAITKTASTLLIIFVGITLFLFASLRILDDGRVIQMNMEISLILAHICLLIPSLYEYETACRIISILIHFFFTACFMFMFLEALHTYSLVAFVVKRSGLFSKMQNFCIGWGVALAIVLFGIGFRYNDYGGEYHCWLQMNKPLVYAQLVPITILVILTFTLIEAAGNADFRRLPGMDQEQLLSAKIMQRTNLIIMPMVYISFLLGAMSEYQQNFGLYGTFTVLNGILGGCVFFFHSTGNEQVRDKLTKGYNLVFKKD